MCQAIMALTPLAKKHNHTVAYSIMTNPYTFSVGIQNAKQIYPMDTT